jgi:hypothetical protein
MLNKTNDGLCIHEIFIAWLKMLMMFLHMISIHVKMYEDDKMLIKKSMKGACKLPKQCQLVK